MLKFYASTNEYAESTISQKMTLIEEEPSHFYQKIDNVSKIIIDGSTVKKGNFLGATGYNTIQKYINLAEQDDTDTILFVIDSVGGETDGVFELEEVIAKCSKRTVTLYKNTGASAAILYGTASKEVYATPYSTLGSIGVLAVYREGTSSGGYKVAVSSNAKNKNCTIENKCSNRIQERIDYLESIMLDKISSNTGVSVDDLVSKLNMGAMVTAEEAKQIGLIKDIVSEPEIMVQLIANKINKKEIAMDEKTSVLRQAMVAVATLRLNAEQALALSGVETFEQLNEQLMALSEKSFLGVGASPVGVVSSNEPKQYTFEDFEKQLKMEQDK